MEAQRQGARGAGCKRRNRHPHRTAVRNLCGVEWLDRRRPTSITRFEQFHQPGIEILLWVDKRPVEVVDARIGFGEAVGEQEDDCARCSVRVLRLVNDTATVPPTCAGLNRSAACTRYAGRSSACARITTVGITSRTTSSTPAASDAHRSLIFHRTGISRPACVAIMALPGAAIRATLVLRDWRSLESP